jgi:beta-1,4-N-acetylglucosaminyltransferase
MTMMNNNSSSQSSSKGGKNLFVTVGTTRFDKLVEAVTSKVALEWMKRQGFSSLTIQFGRGIKPPEISPSSIIDIQTYDFRPSLIDDMEKADLIISHAGAGTVMEVLRMQIFDYNNNNNNNNNDNDNDNNKNKTTTTGTTKKLIVVINTQLMDNHQTELATAMADRGHIFVVDEPEKLQSIKTWTSFEGFVPTPHHEAGDPFDFPMLLDSFLGYPSSDKNE